eukprot:scaffold7095_cov260-Pinguiococcus_pyrenoidosus.AAC.4
MDIRDFGSGRCNLFQGAQHWGDKQHRRIYCWSSEKIVSWKAKLNLRKPAIHGVYRSSESPGKSAADGCVQVFESKAPRPSPGRSRNVGFDGALHGRNNLIIALI